MHRRGLLFMLASAAVGGVAVSTGRLAKAEDMVVTKTDEEWRRLLTPDQYQGRTILVVFGMSAHSRQVEPAANGRSPASLGRGHR